MRGSSRSPGRPKSDSAPTGGLPTRQLLDWLAWGGARLGWPGLAGLALLALGLAWQPFVLMPLDAEHRAAQARLAASVALPPAARVTDAAAPDDDWRALLPPDQHAHARLAALFRAAHATGIRLEQGNYRTHIDHRAGLGRLVVTLPVTGRYAELRAFMAQALNQDAALALEGLRLSRSSIEAAELSAELRFAFYLEPPS